MRSNTDRERERERVGISKNDQKRDKLGERKKIYLGCQQKVSKSFFVLLKADKKEISCQCL